MDVSSFQRTDRRREVIGKRPHPRRISQPRDAALLTSKVQRPVAVEPETRTKRRRFAAGMVVCWTGGGGESGGRMPLRQVPLSIRTRATGSVALPLKQLAVPLPSSFVYAKPICIGSVVPRPTDRHQSLPVASAHDAARRFSWTTTVTAMCA